MARADFITAIGLISLSLYVIFESWRMPRLEHLKIHPLSVPGIVPAFIGGVLLLFGIVLLARSISQGGHRLGISYQGLRRVLGNSRNRRLLLTALLCIGYAGFLIGRLPYWLATGLFVFVFIVLFEWEGAVDVALKSKRVLLAALIALLSSGAITLVFERLFLVTLP